MEDSAIVELYWQRSDMAIPETARKYGGYCHTIAYNICASNEDAEECVNDTWFRAWSLMPDKRPKLLSAFLGCITRNFALDRYRADKSRKRGGGETVLALSELEDCIPAKADVEKHYELVELGAAIRDFVAGLPETERKIFVARYWFLAPTALIAGRLGCSQAKVKTTLYRSRLKLREHLNREGLC